MNVWR